MLPATTSLERNDLGGSPRDRFVIAMHQAIEPVGEARHDFDIFLDLAWRLGCERAFAEGRDETAWLRHIYGAFRERAQSNLVPEFDAFWERGWVEIPPRTDEYVLFAEFRAAPAKNRLRTPSGRIELYSDEIAGLGYDDCPPHPAWIEPAEWLGGRQAEIFPLHLVSSQPRHKLHSQMDAGPVSARGKTAGRETLAINPVDAKARAIGDGEVVRVFNARGACFVGVLITEAVRPGVVRLSCGAWYDPVSDDEKPACAHGNANVLTRDHGTSRLSWTLASDPLVTALSEKLAKRLGSHDPSRLDQDLNDSIGWFLERENALESLRQDAPELYEALSGIISRHATKLSFIGSPDQATAHQILESKFDTLVADFKKSVWNLSDNSTQQLALGTLVDWMMRCPLDFPPYRHAV